MRTLPISARIIVILTTACAALALASARVLPDEHLRAHGWELLLFIGIAVFAYGKKIALGRNKPDQDNGSMSVGFAITFAAMLRFGPVGAMIVSGIGCLSSLLYPKRQQPHQIVFNLSMVVVASWACGIVFQDINANGAVMTTMLPAVAAAALTYFLVNTLSIAAIIACCTGQKIVALWKETFLWTAPSYFAGAGVGTVAVLLFRSNAWETVLFVAPVGYLTYQSYSIYTSRAQEKQDGVERLANLYLSTIKSLALAIDAKDQYTHQHILRVQRYAVATAKKMGLTGNELEGVNTGALLHDIGKLGVPEYVLLKPGRLTDEEFAQIKKHPEIGAAILDPVEFPWPVLPGVKYHHEKWDGTGYPEGLKGEAIPLVARILAVADVFDALTSNRSYRHAWPYPKAVAEIIRCAGTQFDPVVVDAFAQVIDGVVAEMESEANSILVSAPVDVATPGRAASAARDIQRASSELWALYEVAESLSSSIGLQEGLEILGRRLEAILPGTTCLFLLEDAAHEKLSVRCAVGPNRELFQDATTLSADSASRRVVRTGQAYRGEFDPDDLLTQSGPAVTYVPMKASLIVPIVYQGEGLGTINLYHAAENAFEAHDQQLLEMIARRAATAIFNGLLFDRTKSEEPGDALTGLTNVRFLTQHVDACCAAARESDRSLAVLCLDLDSFKPINDMFGHQKGDDVLRAVADIIRSVIGPRQIVARFGGDEFVIVLTDVSAADAQDVAARLQNAAEAYDPGLFHEQVGALHLGVSIGVGCFPEDGNDFATLMSAADARMYRNKTDRKLRILSSQTRLAPFSLPHAA